MEQSVDTRIVSDRLREEALDWALFEQAKGYAFDYIKNILDQSVYPDKAAIDGLDIFKEPLQSDTLKRRANMNIEKRFVLLQNTYAASIAETVNTYDRMGVLPAIVEKRKERQAQTAPLLNQQLGIETVEDVFCRLSEVYGCANWSVERTDNGYIATAVSCKLCALSKRMGGANPCYGWCLDPMFAMISSVSKIDAESITVESTLMDGDCCKVRFS